MTQNKPSFQLQGLSEPKCLSILDSTSMKECIEIFNNRNIGALLVIGGPHKDKLVGIITERDILKHFFKLNEPNALGFSVQKFMTPGVLLLSL